MGYLGLILFGGFFLAHHGPERRYVFDSYYEEFIIMLARVFGSILSAGKGLFTPVDSSVVLVEIVGLPIHFHYDYIIYY